MESKENKCCECGSEIEQSNFEANHICWGCVGSKPKIPNYGG